MKEGFEKWDLRSADTVLYRNGRSLRCNEIDGLLSLIVATLKEDLTNSQGEVERDIMRVTRGNEVVFERSEQPTSSCDEIFKQASKVDKLERYFFFCISYYTKRGSGKINMTVKGEGMPSFKELEESTRKRVSRELSVQESSITVVVENWIEMNEEDFNSWVNCD